VTAEAFSSDDDFEVERLVHDVFEIKVPIARDAELCRSDFTREELARLLDLWRSWNRSHGGEWATGRLEAQVQRIATMLETTGTDIRLWVIANSEDLGLAPEIENPADFSPGDLAYLSVSANPDSDEMSNRALEAVRSRLLSRHVAEFRAQRENWRCLWCAGDLGTRSMYCSETCRDASVAEQASQPEGPKSTVKDKPEPRRNLTLFAIEEPGDAPRFPPELPVNVQETFNTASETHCPERAFGVSYTPSSGLGSDTTGQEGTA